MVKESPRKALHVMLPANKKQQFDIEAARRDIQKRDLFEEMIDLYFKEKSRHTSGEEKLTRTYS